MNVLWGRVVVLGVVLLLVFLLGRATGGASDEIEALQARIASQEAEIDQLEAEKRALATPTPGAGTGTEDGTGTTETPGAGTAGTPGAGTGAGTGTGTGTGGSPAATPSPTVTPTAGSTEAQQYTVQAGDTLGRISNRFYGSTSFAKCIQTANTIADASAIRTGQTLTIPPKPAQPCT
ncbi:MAG TPA: LysM domain-containing protein [Actinomycetota bacterium]|nr:LysM domain-containing protein [Actinomycetota bacterium]